jgi:hypothetical protein
VLLFLERLKKFNTRIKAKINLKESGTPIDLPDCYTRIAEIAYYKAEIRGFEPGHELEDWFEAEQEINARFEAERDFMQ